MKNIMRPIAILLSSAVTLTAIPANAAYGSREEIALSMRALSGEEGVYITENNPNQVYISPEAAAAGTTLHFGVYVETEKPELIFMTLNMQSDCDTITFREDTFINPAGYATDEPVEYTLPDGTVYSSRMIPNCFGSVNSNGVYTSGAFNLMANFAAEENALKVTWMHGSENISGFLGGASDTYSFIEFDIDIAPETPAGIYHLSFLENTDPDVPASKSPTNVTSDEFSDGQSHYSDIVPTLKNAEIVVGGFVSEPAFRFAEDTESFSLTDFSGELYCLENGIPAAIPLTADGFAFSPAAENPAELGITVPQRVEVPLYYNGETVLTSSGTPAMLEYWIGQQGDADRNGTVDAADAAAILVYAAEMGAGGTPLLADGSASGEAFAMYLSDVSGAVDGVHNLDASDASIILAYAAAIGAGETDVTMQDFVGSSNT